MQDDVLMKETRPNPSPYDLPGPTEIYHRVKRSEIALHPEWEVVDRMDDDADAGRRNTSGPWRRPASA